MFMTRPFRKKSFTIVRLFSIMAFYVYVIQSEVDNSYYKGFSENPINRLSQHNNGECVYTLRKMPWAFVYIEELPTKREALIRERSLKKYAHAQIEKLILSNRNCVAFFGSSAG
ncbi:GIY-YIG nuclease family protein [uncultured Mucilaginibacter sp.]|uniref:GIY-YIG nuclease family protein n=2 Tax=uncultured Mucilaginibacter sp. TaxID=797541 RepID=UPI0034353816